MDFSSFAPIFRVLMTDAMDIYRYVETTNSDGTTATTFPSLPLYVGVKCRISFNASDNPLDTAIDQNPIRYAPRVLCPANTDVKAGDMITIRRMNNDGTVLMTYKGRIGEAAVYPTHKAASFAIEESA